MHCFINTYKRIQNFSGHVWKDATKHGIISSPAGRCNTCQKLIGMNKIKTNLIMLITVYFFSSCTVENKIIGTYQYLVPGWIDARLTLNKDSTFDYNSQNGERKFSLSGEWYLKRDKTIVLNSDQQPPEGGISVKEEFNNQQDAVSFKVRTFSGIPLGHATIIINSNPEYSIVTDSTGYGHFENNVDIHTIEVLFLSGVITYNVNNSSSDYFEIEVYYLYNGVEHYFANERWKYKNSKIYCVSCSGTNPLIWNKVSNNDE